MRYIFTLWSCLAILSSSSAQSSPTTAARHKNSLQVWAGGSGFLYSVGYERLLLNDAKLKMGAEVGVGWYPKSTKLIAAWIPLHLNFVMFDGPHHLELGAGVVLTDYFFQKEDVRSLDSDFFLNPRLGYRYQSPNGRYMFRAALTPFYEPQQRRQNQEFWSSDRNISDVIHNTHPWGGVAFGYVF